MVNQNQKEIVYNIVKHNQPIRTERVKIFAMQAGVSCADRYLRWLREDGFLVCEKHPKNRTKTWSLKPQVAAEPDPEPEPETIVESSGQFCMAGATVCLCLAASLLLGTPAAADLWPSGKAMTKEFEGYSATVYCCPAGARTIGYGFNIEEDFVRSLFSSGLLSGKETLKKHEAEHAFGVLYGEAQKHASHFVGQHTFQRLSRIQKDILIDMAYNLGLHRLAGFRKMRAAIQAGNYNLAAKEMKDSKWYHQVGRQRAQHHVKNFAEES